METPVSLVPLGIWTALIFMLVILLAPLSVRLKSGTISTIFALSAIAVTFIFLEIGWHLSLIWN